MAQTTTAPSDSQIKAAEAALAHLDPDEGTWPTGEQVETIIAATTATADTVADTNLARYLDIIAAYGAAPALAPIRFDGIAAPWAFMCADCATVHMPTFDDGFVYPDRYAPAASTTRAGCDDCERLPTDRELPC